MASSAVDRRACPVNPRRRAGRSGMAARRSPRRPRSRGRAAAQPHRRRRLSCARRAQPARHGGRCARRAVPPARCAIPRVADARIVEAARLSAALIDLQVRLTDDGFVRRAGRRASAAVRGRSAGRPAWPAMSGDQLADNRRIGGVTAARHQIALIGVERIAHAGRAVAAGVVAANQNARLVLRLPEVSTAAPSASS